MPSCSSWSPTSPLTPLPPQGVEFREEEVGRGWEQGPPGRSSQSIDLLHSLPQSWGRRTAHPGLWRPGLGPVWGFRGSGWGSGQGLDLPDFVITFLPGTSPTHSAQRRASYAAPAAPSSFPTETDDQPGDPAWGLARLHLVLTATCEVRAGSPCPRSRVLVGPAF